MSIRARRGPLPRSFLRFRSRIAPEFLSSPQPQFSAGLVGGCCAATFACTVDEAVRVPHGPAGRRCGAAAQPERRRWVAVRWLPKRS